ncbi:MAG: glucosamine-6-phosphate isomerase [Clostridia bacterium]|nr:glucosamine-6-phosphate isomerase [Clostridia bacterium]
MNEKLVKTEWDVYFDMALTMLETVIKNSSEGKRTVMIVPVGPTDQYPILARLINTLRVSFKNVWFFNMDEYMTDESTVMSTDHPLSFEARMNREFYSQVDPELVMPESQRLFPRPGKEAEYDRLLSSLGGADLCLGGLGINGHIAFNEPQKELSAQEFASLPTRVLKISTETRTINANGYARGDISALPEYCITIGMKQILASKKIYIALNRAWQHGPYVNAFSNAPTAQNPASLLQEHKDVTFCMIDSIK